MAYETMESGGHVELTTAIFTKVKEQIDGELVPKIAKNVKWTEQNVLGAKNMLPNTAQNRTANGLTFTVLSDGCIKAVGTATADTTLEINNGFSIPAGEYRLWKGEKSAGVYMVCMRADNTRFEIGSGYQNSDATFTEPQTFTRTYFWVNNGTVLDTVFYPMLSVKSALVAEPAYEPYALTNQQATAKIAELEARNVAVSGITPAFLTDAPKYTAGWLSLSASRVETQTTTDPGTGEETNTNVTVYGEPLTPTEGTVYVVLSDGAFLRQLFTWNGMVYRHVGKINVREDADVIVYDDRTFNVTPQDAGSNYNTERTSWQGDVVAGETVDISVVVDNGEGGSTKLYWGEEVVWIAGVSTSGTQTYHRVANADINVKLCARSSTSTGAKGGAIRSGTVRIHKEYADHETLEYVPSTADKDGQPGLVPPSPAGADNSTVLTAQGWDEHRFDLTDEDITNLFARSTENAAGPMYVATQEFQRYSTDEIVVGEWTDGKPLYRRVLSGTSGATSSWKNNAVELSPECRIVFAQIYINNGDEAVPVPYGTGDSRYLIVDNAINVHTGTVTNNANKPLVAICHYTKTTDTASSPKVPYEPLVEYSTEEKMIGYWIDGKPLYRKTVDVGRINGTTFESPHGISGLEKAVNIEGVVITSAGTWFLPVCFSHPAGTAMMSAVYVTNSAIGFRLGNTATALNGSAYITITYTKTTD